MRYRNERCPQAPVRERRGFFCLTNDECRTSNASSRCSGSTRRRDAASARSPTSPSARRRSRRGSRPRAQRVAAAKEQLAENQNARRAIEKDVAVHQGRLSKFRDQAMAVKTNHGVSRHPEGDRVRAERGQDARRQDARADARSRRPDRRRQDAPRPTLAAEQKAVDAERRAMAAEHAELKASLERIAAERAALVGGARPAACCSIFELVVASAATASPSPKRATASARSATCACGRRSSTPSCRNEADPPVRPAATGSCTSCRAGRRRRRRVAAAGIVTSTQLDSGRSPSSRIRTGRRVHRRRRARQSRARPASASASSSADGDAGRGVRRVDRRRHQQRRRVPGAARRARVGAAPRPSHACTCGPTRCCSCSRCSATIKVKHPGLQPLHAKARLLAHEIGRVTFEHVRRESNAHADRLANAAMDDAAEAPDRAGACRPRRRRRRGDTSTEHVRVARRAQRRRR